MAGAYPHIFCPFIIPPLTAFDGSKDVVACQCARHGNASARVDPLTLEYVKHSFAKESIHRLDCNEDVFTCIQSWHIQRIIKHYLFLKSVHYLYIDESGDPGRYLDLNKKVILNSSKYFTLAGIIIDSQSAATVSNDVRKLALQYFPQSIVDTTKLHYNQLIQNAPPYDSISDEDNLHLADGMFEIICNSSCTLLSVTIDLENHYKKYRLSAENPKAYAMLIMLERFQDFLESKDSQGAVFYERFNRRERRNIEITMKRLKKMLKSKRYVELNNIIGNIRNGDPLKEPILQLADFFAYATQIMYRTKGEKKRRWDSIKEKYFKFNGAYYDRGNVGI